MPRHYAQRLKSGRQKFKANIIQKILQIWYLHEEIKKSQRNIFKHCNIIDWIKQEPRQAKTPPHLKHQHDSYPSWFTMPSHTTGSEILIHNLWHSDLGDPVSPPQFFSVFNFFEVQQYRNPFFPIPHLVIWNSLLFVWRTWVELS